jgi:hypothetical protein
MVQPASKPREHATSPRAPAARRPSGSRPSRKSTLSAGARRCRAKFLHYFPKGFGDPDYVGSERNYKWNAHLRWEDVLNQNAFRALLDVGHYQEIARHAISIESRTNLLFSFEKMALRDAVKSRGGAQAFAQGLYDFLYGDGNTEARFNRWRDAVAALPRRQTRVLTWPVVTVMGFIAQPRVHMYLKPTVTRRAAQAYGFGFVYRSDPSWETYLSLLDFARIVARDTSDLHPRDLIDVQSFIWVQGSDEYPD